MREFTVGQLFDAIEKNGLPQGIGNFFFEKDKYSADNIKVGYNVPTKERPIVAACAMGQACINLGVHPQLKWRFKYNIEAVTITDVTTTIVAWNDSDRLSFKEIAKVGRTHFSDILDEIIEADEYDFGSNNGYL